MIKYLLLLLENNYEMQNGNKFEFKFQLSRNTIISIYYSILCYIMLKFLYETIQFGFPKASWNITEFLINYRGGFVRRGLLGEILLKLYYYFGLSPYNVIIFISLSCFFLLTSFIIINLIKKGYSIFTIPFILVLGNPVLNNFVVRKDLLIVLLFIGTVYFVLKKGVLNLILSNLIFIVGILIHESIGFITFPIFLSILYYQNNNIDDKIKRFFVTLLKALPAIISFFIVLKFPGNMDVANKIWQSWMPIPFPNQDVNVVEAPAAIESLSWTLNDSKLLWDSTLNTFSNNIYAPIVWIFIVLATFFIFSNFNRLNYPIFNYKPKNIVNISNFTSIVMLQFICVLPLFYLGWDYSRWIFYWVLTSLCLLVLLPNNKVQSIIPSILNKVSNSFNNGLNFFIPSYFALPLLLVIGMSPYNFDFNSFINSSSVYQITKYISSFFI